MLEIHKSSSASLFVSFKRDLILYYLMLNPDLTPNTIDYVSDYQLKSACKDAICIAPSKVTRMIFAVLED